MPRYIDAEPFEKELKADIGFFKEDGNRASALRFSNFLDRVKSQPTADVAPVVHAHWFKGRDGVKVFCSACLSFIEGELDGVKANCKFCFNCGSQMDEEAKEDAEIH